jgi:hypothetical protein
LSAASVWQCQSAPSFSQVLCSANPSLPVPKYPVFQVDVGPVDTGTDDYDEDAKRAVVDQAAAILGAPVSDRHGHYEIIWRSRGEDPYHR